MNEGTHWGQGYNQPTKGCSAEERPKKRPLTLTFNVIRGRSKSPRTAGKNKSRKLLLVENAAAIREKSYISKFSPEHSYSEAD
jgi:hypothetical protein